MSRKKIRAVVDKVHYDADKDMVVGAKGHLEVEVFYDDVWEELGLRRAD